MQHWVRHNRWKALVFVCVAVVFAYLIYGAVVGPAAPAKPSAVATRSTTTVARKKHRRASVTQNETPRFGIAWPQGRPLRVLFIGDSLTAGYYASSEANAFTHLVTAALEKRGPVEMTVDARGSTQVADYMRATLPATDLAVIELGTNDYSSDLTQADRFDANYTTLIRNIEQTSPGATILCLSIWRTASLRYLGALPLTSYNTMINIECGRHGTYVPITSLYDYSGSRGPEGSATAFGPRDSFHPNDIGHRDIADAILSALNG